MKSNKVVYSKAQEKPEEPVKPKEEPNRLPKEEHS
jgi:hypothetical protein